MRVLNSFWPAARARGGALKRQWLTGLALATSIAFGARTASAARTARLVLQRGPEAETCTDDAGLRARVVERLGYDPIEDDAPLEIRASIRKVGERLRGRVEVIEPGAAPGVREIDAALNDCAELASAMALTIAIAIDPLLLSRPPPAEDPASAARAAERRLDPEPPSTPDPSASATARPEAPADDRRAIGFRTGAGALVSLGTAPSPSAGGVVKVGASLGRLSLDLEGRVDTPGSTSHVRGEVTSSMLVATLAPCVHAGVGVFCALGSLARIHAEGRGVDVPRERAALLGAVGGRIGVEVPVVGALAIGAHADVWIPLRSFEFELDGDKLWRSPPLAGSLGVSALVRFPRSW